MLDLLTRVFFEDLWLLAPLLLVAMAVALAVHRRHRTRATRRGLVGTLLACVALLVIQQVVVTDREALQALVRDMVTAVNEGDVPGLGRSIADAGVQIGAGGRAVETSHQDFLAMVNVGLQRYHVENAGSGGFRFEVRGDTAIVNFRVTCDIREGEGRPYRSPSFWTIECTRGADGWRLRRINAADLGIEGLVSTMDIVPYLQGFHATAQEVGQ